MSTAKPPPSDLPIHAFPNASAFDAFLSASHATLPGFHLKFAKKASGIPTVTGAEAVEVALCHGWIDGRANGLDERFYLVRYTPRRAKSIWSKKNVASTERLIADGRMRPAGQAAIDAAKADGRWDRAYAGPATMEEPADFTAALEADEAASEVFEGLNRGERYSVLWRVETASPAARAGRIAALVRGLAEGEVPGAVEKERSRAKAKAARGSAAKRGVESGAVKKAGAEKSAAKKVAAKAAAKVSGDGAAAGKGSVAASATEGSSRPRRPGLRPRP